MVPGATDEPALQTGKASDRTLYVVQSLLMYKARLLCLGEDPLTTFLAMRLSA
jgi:hypothetical protein